MILNLRQIGILRLISVKEEDWPGLCYWPGLKLCSSVHKFTIFKPSLIRSLENFP